jgi:murein DD-endopeptidase MepM/ murein hydrolase activator NlpD
VNEGNPFFGKNREGGTRWHEGGDFLAEEGDSVYAAGDGVTVDMAPYNRSSTFGNQVVIDHGGGIFTQSAHLQDGPVKPGTVVKAGTIIGRVGRSGIRSDTTQIDTHLHYEIRLLFPEAVRGKDQWRLLNPAKILYPFCPLCVGK